MKKIVLYLVIIVFTCLFVGCSPKKDEEVLPDDGQVGMANPIKSYTSLDEINKVVGCNIVIPESLLIDDVVYSTINDQLAEVNFKYLDHFWTIRGSKNIDADISGIYDENNVFEKNQNSTVYLNEYYIERMFEEGQQYTIVLDDPLDVDETVFSDTVFAITRAIKFACDPNKIAGEYADSTSQRATMTIDKYEDNYEIYVSWASSASDYTEWYMTAHLEDGKLNYAGENFATHTFDENGQEMIGDGASNNLGYFEVKDGKLYWTGAAQDLCKTCIFEKIS